MKRFVLALAFFHGCPLALLASRRFGKFRLNPFQFAKAPKDMYSRGLA